MKIYFFKYLMKDFLCGILIFLIPLVSFLKPYNLKQLNIDDIYLLILSQIIILILLIMLHFIFYSAFKFIFKYKLVYPFTLISVGYYILFFFIPLNIFFEDVVVGKTILSQKFFDNNFSFQELEIYTIFFLFSIWISFILIFIYLNKLSFILIKSFIFFSLLNIFFIMAMNLYYINEIFSKNDLLKKNEGVLISNSNLERDSIKKNKVNVYYIILDSMSDIQQADNYKLIKLNKIKKILETSKLKYISKTYSSYNMTYLTLTSIMEIDFPIIESDTKYVNRGKFYSSMMYRNKLIPLPELVTQTGSKFIWVGNFWGNCVELLNKPWKCIYDKSLINIMRLTSTIYFTTPLKPILLKWLSQHLDYNGQRNIKNYVNYRKNNKKENQTEFVFIHQLSPHGPHNVSNDCTPNKYIDEYTGYKSSYNCVIKEIAEFMKLINKDDPDAIVVFQGDHGWINPNEISTDKEKVKLKAKIFNAIKAPNECFEKFGNPETTINTIRFVLNCAYGYNLPFLRKFHYQGFYENNPNYGIVHKNEY